MPRRRQLDDEGLNPAMMAHPSQGSRAQAWEETVAELTTPGHKPYTVNHPSGLVGQHMGTHLSVYAKSLRDPDSPPRRLVARVLFNKSPESRTSHTGWPDEMDAIEALDDVAKRLPGFLPRSL